MLKIDADKNKIPLFLAPLAPLRFLLPLSTTQQADGADRAQPAHQQLASTLATAYRQFVRTAGHHNMIGIKVAIERFTSDSQPGWVACRLIDAAGTHHVFEEKVPVVTVEPLDASSDYPRVGIIGCTVIQTRMADEGRELLTVDTASPWGIESTTGASRFDVFRDQIVNFSHPAG